MTTKIEKLLFYSLILFLPTQFGKHFWPDFSFVSGIRVDYLSPTLYFTDILVVGLFAVWLIKKFKIRHSPSVIPDLHPRMISRDIIKKIIFLFIIIFLVLNIIYSKNIWGGYYHLLKFLEISFLAYYVAAFIKEKDQIKILAMFFSLGIIFEASLAFYQYITQGSLGGLLYFLGERTFTSSTPGIANASLDGQLVLRPYGTFSHPNVLAGYLAAGLVFVMGSIGEIKRISVAENFTKLLLFTAFVFGSFALFLTMSRVAIVFYVISLIVVLARKTKIFIFLLFTLLSFIFFSSPLLPRFSQTSISEEAFIHREKLMDAAAVMVSSNFFTGVGLGNFLPTLSTIQSPLSLGLYLQPVHNIYLLIVSELGILGFVLFVWFLSATVGHAMSRRENHVFAAMLFSVVVLGFFDHYFLTLQQGQLLVALIVGLCWTRIK